MHQRANPYWTIGATWIMLCLRGRTYAEPDLLTKRLAVDEAVRVVLTGGPVNRLLINPVFDRSPGVPSWPPTRGHSEYWRDAAFEAAIRRVLELRG